MVPVRSDWLKNQQGCLGPCIDTYHTLPRENGEAEAEVSSTLERPLVLDHRQQQQQQQSTAEAAADQPTTLDINQSSYESTMLEGFELWVPPTPPEFDDGMPFYEILGTDSQIVQFPLRAGRQIVCFSGAMAYMSDKMTMSVALAGFKKTFGRLAGGGSLFEITYTNDTDRDGYIACTPDYPGVIVPINMSTSGKIIALRDSFLCSTVGLGIPNTDISGGFNPASSVAAFCCSGIDFIVQTIENGEWAFLMAMGTVVKKTLKSGESILVDGDSILCFESSVTVDVRAVGGIAAMCCGGEGLFNTELVGPGTIWLQSMSIDKMRKLFPPTVVSGGSGDGGGADFS